MNSIRSTVQTAVLAAAIGFSGLGYAAGPLPLPAGEPAPRVSAALRSAAAGGDARAQYDLATALACGRGARANPAEAARWFEKAARQGHLDSKSALGWMAMTGRGIARDDARALELLTEAAEAGNASAQNNLGVMYALGQGVPVDEAKAEKWFDEAAKRGALDAVRNREELRKGNSRTARPTQVIPDVRT